MNLLLDTHVLLWALLEPQKLSPALRNALEDSDNTLAVSAASAWEIATQWRLGQLQQASAVARQAGLWDVPHRDPSDRQHGSCVRFVRGGDDAGMNGVGSRQPRCSTRPRAIARVTTCVRLAAPSRRQRRLT